MKSHKEHPCHQVPIVADSYTIIGKELLAKRTICKMIIEAPLIAQKALAGQFIMIRVNETGERVPMTITEKDLSKGTITIYYQVVGKTTALMRNMKVGDRFADVVGPLGQPDEIEKIGKIVMVGGGTGTAVLYHITQAYRTLDNYLVGIVGARDKDLIILDKEMGELCDELILTTDDGSCGQKGLVTEALMNYLKTSHDVKLVWAIGPLAMMKAVCNITRLFQIKTMVSLNPIMVDGTGMCGCCRVTVSGQTRFACVDGPSFNGHLVDFDELLKRKGMYLNQERESLLFSVR
ncbi:MAG: sulfide/dihydroorotate dehydrogenase-like FAD/NAD-binding protein [Syntrophaceae bacterium]|nr:sulfide/dihydroorotate dehydrogenase-like FAD/NAD-binding protein [Syntrophaceae bacterium]